MTGIASIATAWLASCLAGEVVDETGADEAGVFLLAADVGFTARERDWRTGVVLRRG